MKNEERLFDLELLIATFLSFVGGMMEIYSLQINGMFAGMQTGNLIAMLVSFIDGSFLIGISRLAVIFIFILGTFLNKLLFILLKYNYKKYHLVTLICEIVFLSTLFIIPFNDNEHLKLISNIFIALFAAFQFAGFYNIHNKPFSSTMMTNMMKNIGFSFAYLADKTAKNKGKTIVQYILILTSFILGIIAFYLPYSFIHSNNDNLFIKLIIGVPVLILFMCIFICYKIDTCIQKD